jgi:2-dehydropantoate 2-reductase
MRSYAVVGTGAVGGLYGALLQRSGQDVHFLMRSDYSFVHDHGLRVDTPLGDFQLEKVHAYSRPENMPRCDVIVVAWKTTSNHDLAEVLPKIVKPGAIILVLQNGLDPEREAQTQAPGCKILGGMCYVAAYKAGPGWIRHLAYGAITLAAYAPTQPLGITREMQEVGEDFREAGVEIVLQADWRTTRWQKLVWNVPFNGLCALLGADTQALLRSSNIRDLLKDMMEEVVAGALACGCNLPEDIVQRMFAITDVMTNYKPSMQVDRDAGRPMELDAIYGRTLEAIHGAGGHAPRMETVLAQLRYIDVK